MPIRGIYYSCRINNSMMTRCNSRSYISRTSHHLRNKRPTMRNNLIYYVRGSILLRIFLSILPQQTITNTRIRLCMTPYRNYTPKSIQSSSSKHSSITSVRCNSNMSSPQTARTKPSQYNSSPYSNSSLRSLFYISSSRRIHRSIFQNRRQSVWINLLRSYRIPRRPRFNWFNIPISMPKPSNFTPLLITPPLRV